MSMSSEHQTTQSSLKPFMVGSDWLWMLALAGLIALNVYISTHDFRQAHQTETTRQNAGLLMDELIRQGRARQGSMATPGACGASSLWVLCRDAIVIDLQSQSVFKNVIRPDGLVFADVCDRASPKTLGAILVEKGTPRPGDPNVLSFEPVSDHQRLDSPLTLRIAVCGRLFSKMVMGALTL